MNYIDLRNEYANAKNRAFDQGCEGGFRADYTEWLENKLIEREQEQALDMHGVSSNEAKRTADSIWNELKRTKLVSTPNDGDCFRADAVVRAINRFSN